MTPLRLRVGGATDVGRTRSANEDAFLCDDGRALYVVADGMGGHRAGDVASATALEAVDQSLAGDTALEEAIRAANAAVFEKAQANPEMRGMGTTVTALRVVDGTARIGHVGDSRAYLLRDGQLTRVTDDHSLVEELVREGRLTPDQAAVHPQRSVITRALGIEDSVDVDTYDIELRSGDRILLCSDGLTSMLRDDTILDVIREYRDSQAAADALVTAANEAGGEDNITVVVIDVEGDDDRSAALAASATLTDSGPATGEWEQVPRREDSATTGRAGRRRRAGGSIPIKRILLFLLPVVVVLAAAFGALAWYGRNSYFVGLDGERVTVFKGVPGGFLVWDPTVEARTGLTADDLTDHQLADIEDGHEFSSRAGARRYVERLERRVEEARQATATTTTAAPTSTTTTAP